MASSPVKISKALSDERRRRSQEWRAFRRTYLFSQRDLATALKCSLRSVQACEGGESTPLPRTLKRFRELARAEREKAA